MDSARDNRRHYSSYLNFSGWASLIKSAPIKKLSGGKFGDHTVKKSVLINTQCAILKV